MKTSYILHKYFGLKNQIPLRDDPEGLSVIHNTGSIYLQ